MEILCECRFVESLKRIANVTFVVNVDFGGSLGREHICNFHADVDCLKVGLKETVCII